MDFSVGVVIFGHGRCVPRAAWRKAAAAMACPDWDGPGGQQSIRRACIAVAKKSEMAKMFARHNSKKDAADDGGGREVRCCCLVPTGWTRTLISARCNWKQQARSVNAGSIALVKTIREGLGWRKGKMKRQREDVRSSFGGGRGKMRAASIMDREQGAKEKMENTILSSPSAPAKASKKRPTRIADSPPHGGGSLRTRRCGAAGP